jgi:ABC-type enterochelin transport system permease subunit
MKNFKNRIAEVSQYLQRLMEPDVFAKVQNAVERKDRNLLAEVCRKIEIPLVYVPIIVSLLLSVSPQQKWPVPEW